MKNVESSQTGTKQPQTGTKSGLQVSCFFFLSKHTNVWVYHCFQNHYTHKMTIFKLCRSLQLQFSGPTGIKFRYSYSFVGLTGRFLYSYSSVQLHKKWSVELFS